MQKRQPNKKESCQGAGKEKEEEGMEKQGLLPLIVLLLIPPLLHTKKHLTPFICSAQLFQLLPHTQGYTNSHNMEAHSCRLTDSMCFLAPSALLTRQHEIRPSLEVGGLSSVTPQLLLPPHFHPFLMAPPSSGAP